MPARTASAPSVSPIASTSSDRVVVRDSGPCEAVVADSGPDSLFAPRYLAVTVGFIASVLLTAFEAMAVSTAMPVAVADLHGLPYYSLAFSAYLTLSLLGMVLAGQRADRRGPRLPFLGGLGVFGVGLLLAGTATGMGQFVAGRAVQGLGGGMVIVSLYVLVGRAFPERLHGRAFSAMAICWVLPGIVGPLIAGLVTEHLSWRWIFLGVMVLIVFPVALLLRPLNNLPPVTGGKSARPVTLSAVLTASGVGLLQYGSQDDTVVGVLLIVVGLAALAYLPRLLPVGTLRARRGLPTVIALRGLLAGSYFGIEAFIPLMLVDHRHTTPTIAGLALTGSAISWALAAWLTNRDGVRARVSRARQVRLGISIEIVSLAGTVAAISPRTPIWTAAAAMFCAAFGLGLAFPNISVLTLELSAPGDQGANSASLQVADGVSSTLAVAVAGAIYHGEAGVHGAGGRVFAVMYALLIGLSCVAWLIAPRVRVR